MLLAFFLTVFQTAQSVRSHDGFLLTLNSTSSSNGQSFRYSQSVSATKLFSESVPQIVPGYYVRRNLDGQIENSTCMNNTASEHYMFSRFIVDDLLHWATQYKVLASRPKHFISCPVMVFETFYLPRFAHVDEFPFVRLCFCWHAKSPETAVPTAFASCTTVRTSTCERTRTSSSSLSFGSENLDVAF